MWIVPWDLFLMKKLLKSEVCGSRDWKVAEKVTVCTVHTPKSTITAWKEEKVENADVNAGKRKTHFPNAHWILWSNLCVFFLMDLVILCDESLESLSACWMGHGYLCAFFFIWLELMVWCFLQLTMTKGGFQDMSVIKMKILGAVETSVVEILA